MYFLYPNVEAKKTFNRTLFFFAKLAYCGQKCWIGCDTTMAILSLLSIYDFFNSFNLGLIRIVPGKCPPLFLAGGPVVVVQMADHLFEQGGQRLVIVPFLYHLYQCGAIIVGSYIIRYDHFSGAQEFNDLMVVRSPALVFFHIVADQENVYPLHLVRQCCRGN